MNVYMVERNLGGISMQDLAAAQKAAIDTAAGMRGAGTEVRYIRSVFSPGDGRCLCLFEGPSAADIEALNRTAGLPFERIGEAMDLPGPST